VIVIIWLGLFPQPVLNTAKSTLDHLKSVQSAIHGKGQQLSNVLSEEGGNHE
jgi:NADH:ubiquinone oxidoreductase subunit 4 (subunit M)